MPNRSGLFKNRINYRAVSNKILHTGIRRRRRRRRRT